VVVTHAHPDHVKGAAELRARTGAPVLIHAADAPWLAAGRVPSSGRSGLLGRTLDRLPALHWTPLDADGLLGDGDLVEATEGLRVLHTPGHSPGHIVLVHEPTDTVLVGDALFHRSDLALGPAALAADPSTRLESLRRIPGSVRRIGFAHGEAIGEDGVEAFHAFLKSDASS
jgi:glyoxylase-like metal-dependent hydrolase (beta-lactamase superfamily II)